MSSAATAASQPPRKLSASTRSSLSETQNSKRKRSPSPASNNNQNTTSGGGAVKRRKDMTASEKWTWAQKQIVAKSMYAAVARIPFNVARLHSFKEYFLDELGLMEKELTVEEFVTRFGEALKGRDFSRGELEEYFKQIDTDCSNLLDWNEFSSYVLNQAKLEEQLERDQDRGRDFVKDTEFFHPSSHFHKQSSVERLLPIGNPKFQGILGGAHSASVGMFSCLSSDASQVRLWTKPMSNAEAEGTGVSERDGRADSEPELTCFWHNTCGETKEAGTHSAVKISPIADIAIAEDGSDSSVFVVGSDRSINVYNARTKKLVQRFRGYPTAASQFIVSTLGSDRGIFGNDDPGDGVSMVRLLNMEDFPASFAVARPGVWKAAAVRDPDVSFHGDEVFFFGMQEGSVMCYPSERHTIKALRNPLKVYNDLHDAKRVHKLKFSSAFGGIVSASWSNSSPVKLWDPETGLERYGFDGVRRQIPSTVDPTHFHQLQSITTCGFGAGAVDIDCSELRHTTGLMDFALNEREHLIATVAAQDKKCLLWSPSSSTCPIGMLRSPTSHLTSVCFSPDQYLCTTLDTVGTIRIFDLRTNRQRQVFHFEEPESSPALHIKNEYPRRIDYEAKTGTLITANRSLTTWTLRKRIAASAVHNDAIISCLMLDSTAGKDDGWILSHDSNECAAFSVKRGIRRMMFCPFSSSSSSSSSGSSGSSGGGGEGEEKSSSQNSIGGGGGGNSAGGEEPIVAMALDRFERRLFFASKTAQIKVFNARTGMQLGASYRPRYFKPFESGDVFAIAPLTSGDATQRLIVVATSTELHLSWDQRSMSVATRDQSIREQRHRVWKTREKPSSPSSKHKNNHNRNNNKDEQPLTSSLMSTKHHVISNDYPNIVNIARGTDPDDKSFLPLILIILEDCRVLLMNAANCMVVTTIQACQVGGKISAERELMHQQIQQEKQRILQQQQNMWSPNSASLNTLPPPPQHPKKKVTGKRGTSPPFSLDREQEHEHEQEMEGGEEKRSLVRIRKQRGASASQLRRLLFSAEESKKQQDSSGFVNQHRVEDMIMIRKKEMLVLCFEQTHLLEFYNARYHHHICSRWQWPLQPRDEKQKEEQTPSFCCLASDSRGELLFAGDHHGNIFVFDIRDVDPMFSSDTCSSLSPQAASSGYQKNKYDEKKRRNSSATTASVSASASEGGVGGGGPGANNNNFNSGRSNNSGTSSNFSNNNSSFQNPPPPITSSSTSAFSNREPPPPPAVSSSSPPLPLQSHLLQKEQQQQQQQKIPENNLEHHGSVIRLLKVWKAHGDVVSRLQFCNSAMRVISMSTDLTLKCWTPLGQEIGNFGPSQSFSEIERGDGEHDPLAAAAILSEAEKNDVPLVIHPPVKSKSSAALNKLIKRWAMCDDDEEERKKKVEQEEERASEKDVSSLRYVASTREKRRNQQSSSPLTSPLPSSSVVVESVLDKQSTSSKFASQDFGSLVPGERDDEQADKNEEEGETTKKRGQLVVSSSSSPSRAPAPATADQEASFFMTEADERRNHYLNDDNEIISHGLVQFHGSLPPLARGTSKLLRNPHVAQKNNKNIASLNHLPTYSSSSSVSPQHEQNQIRAITPSPHKNNEQDNNQSSSASRSLQLTPMPKSKSRDNNNNNGNKKKSYNSNSFLLEEQQRKKKEEEKQHPFPWSAIPQSHFDWRPSKLVSFQHRHESQSEASKDLPAPLRDPRGIRFVWKKQKQEQQEALQRTLSNQRKANAALANAASSSSNSSSFSSVILSGGDGSNNNNNNDDVKQSENNNNNKSAISSTSEPDPRAAMQIEIEPLNYLEEHEKMMSKAHHHHHTHNSHHHHRHHHGSSKEK